jgi:hypothetical protein
VKGDALCRILGFGIKITDQKRRDPISDFGWHRVNWSPSFGDNMRKVLERTQEKAMKKNGESSVPDP